MKLTVITGDPARNSTASVDVVIAVDPQLSTVEAHAIADAIEALLQQQYAVEDSTIHIEPT